MPQSKEGQKIPRVAFRTRTEGGEWKNLTSGEISKGNTNRGAT